MDKVLGLFTTVFLGIPLVVVTMVICWWMDDERTDKGTDKRQPDNDTDIRIYIPRRCRNRRSNNRSDMENER